MSSSAPQTPVLVSCSAFATGDTSCTHSNDTDDTFVFACNANTAGSPLHSLHMSVKRALTDECTRLSEIDRLCSRADLLTRAVQHIRRHCETALALFASEYNALSPQFVLASELLAAIFGFLDFKDRISASHVCRAWRDSSLGASASLWNTIIADDSTNDGVVAQRIARVPRDVPVDLCMWITDDNSDETLEVIRGNMHRLRLLWLKMDDELTDEVRVAVRLALQQPAPVLEGMRVLDDSSNLSNQGLSSQNRGEFNVFGGVAPRLSIVKFYGQHEFIAAMPSHIPRVVFSQRRKTTLDHIRSVIQQFSLAMALSIECEGWTPPDPTTDLTKIQFSDSLQTFVLSQDDDEIPLTDILGYLEHSALKYFAVHYRQRSTRDEALVAFVALLAGDAASVRRLQVLSGQPGDVDITAFFDDGRQRASFRTPLQWTTAFDQFRHLRNLEVFESLLFGLLDDRSLELRNVEQLTIYLVPMRQQKDDWATDTIFLLNRKPDSWLVGQNLRCITIRGTYSHIWFDTSINDARTISTFNIKRDSIAVGPDVLREFVGWHVDCEHRLKLTLHGVELVTHDMVSVAHLLNEVDLVVEPLRMETAEERSPFNEMIAWDSDERFPYLDQV